MAVQHIGVRAHDYGKRTPESLFQAIRSDGFDAVQLALPKAIEGIDALGSIPPAVEERLRKAQETFRIHVSVLGAYIDPALVNDAARREQGVNAFVQSLPIGKALGADCLGTETSWLATQPGVTRQDALRTLYHSLETILPQAERLGVNVGIEPVAVHTVNTPELAAEVLKTAASPRLRIIFDPVNLLTAAELSNQDALWERSFEAFGDKIAAVHFKGAALDGDGKLAAADFARSVVHYAYLVERLQKLPQPFSLLRDEMEAGNGAADHAFLAGLLK